jgi:hypothetical protein
VSPEGQAGLGRLHDELAAGADPLLASALRAPAPGAADGLPRPAGLAAAGPRTAGRADEYALLVATIHEGYSLHYLGRGLVVAAADPDLALLLGDQLYALGLERLSAMGDLDGVAELADVISLVAQAHAAADAGLADAVWEAGATAVGWGSTPDLDAAKALARAGDPGAGASLRSAAERARASAAT